VQRCIFLGPAQTTRYWHPTKDEAIKAEEMKAEGENMASSGSSRR